MVMGMQSSLYLVMSLRGAKRRSNPHRLVLFGGRLLRFARNDNKALRRKSEDLSCTSTSGARLSPASGPPLPSLPPPQAGEASGGGCLRSALGDDALLPQRRDLLGRVAGERA